MMRQGRIETTMVTSPTTETTQASAKPPTATMPIVRERLPTEGMDGAGARVASAPSGGAGTEAGTGAMVRGT